ncbi:MAG TPA: YceH family protein [Candidatus Eremiobacteraceae bacterium]|nr:YceH family protein [Candidatus Eremiobacteraceae bacterium]
MNFNLSPVEARVLGCLIEKEITTPDYYPLSLNALQNAANQKSNRDPVMDLDEEPIRRALHSLSDQGLARSAATDARVAKFEHRLADVFNFHRHEIALICVLLLRGPQTPGELRTRTERLYAFDDLNGVHSALNLLMNRQPPLVKLLARQPGTKEARYAHLLSGEVADQTLAADKSAPSESASAAHEASVAATYSERLLELERDVADLRNEVTELKQQLAAFQKQFQ